MEIRVTKSETPGVKPDDDALGFGQIFTDHMFNMDYSEKQGWHNPRIEPFGDMNFSPATMVFHYGQAIFEGLKAYRNENGDIQLFRAGENFKRMNRSARGLCIPELDMDMMMEALKQLLAVDKDWVPSSPGTSLYIRPTVIATDSFLGVRPSKTYRFFIILSPVGAYYPEGFNPVKIWVSKEHVRAVRGGVGEYKTAGNYAASLYASARANEAGYAQVLWLDGVQLKYIEEVGAMNIFFQIGDELVTPALNGSILPGITRDSVISLAERWDMKVSERLISIDEVVDAGKTGGLREIFGTGTAAVISPVGELKYGEEIIKVGDGTPGQLAVQFYDELTGIQYGARPDPENWVEVVA
ncbi:MAG: branched-chain amino acid aminotransferase [Thermodesulfobacteriota bacterium]